MAAVEATKAAANKDLQPIYNNILNNAEKAFAKVQAKNGEIYYMSWSSDAIVWSYVKDVTPSNANAGSVADAPNVDIHISIGSYSINSKFLGVSGYVWSNLGVSRLFLFLTLRLSDNE